MALRHQLAQQVCRLRVTLYCLSTHPHRQPTMDSLTFKASGVFHVTSSSRSSYIASEPEAGLLCNLPQILHLSPSLPTT